MKKVFISFLMMTLVTPAFGYEELSKADCEAHPTFQAYSCGQCFIGGAKGEGEHIGFLQDDWVNGTDFDRILYKEEQLMPEMMNLNASNVSWTQTPDSEDFWEYTDEFNALYSDNEEGYVLKAGQSVTWLKSKLGYAYKLDKNLAGENEEIGMLVYPVSVHNMLADGDVTIDNEEHKECVLFTSGDAVEEMVPEPKKLPDTGPAESMLLILLAMILGFGILKVRARS